ncbi:type VI secretion system tube protein TssD [Dyadobacter sp. 32]|uniref:type VI secretion system tube protein TssD n=1 Tax=Dyadobacter sp. 32 TaxID=538966 RepID=UPI0011ECE07F
MAHKAEITIDGKKFEVLHCSYSLHQHVNPHTNETTSEVFGGNIDVTIETRNADAKIIELMVLPHKDDISGEIKFNNQKGEELRTIKFNHASVVNFSETFSLSGSGSGNQSFTICSKELDIQGQILNLKRE